MKFCIFVTLALLLANASAQQSPKVSVSAPLEDASYLVQEAKGLDSKCQVRSPDLTNIPYDTTTGLAKFEFEFAGQDRDHLNACILKLMSNVQALGDKATLVR